MQVSAWLDTSVRKCKSAYSLCVLEAFSLINLVAADEVATTLESFIPEVAVMGWKAASALKWLIHPLASILQQAIGES
jgi:hypothetical protein